ncbi:hypothetical protein KGQ20_38280 [Catenulispora sp. NF23]|uniref:Uncharacterized protein n=1 Tax=Catenulispora pinistramenti TaxID=2705254 RepID=A0ABS5L5B2_9ACTN|nr:hypothetical protein [Catenulispora pinistramenti]MBS2538611.1 hypothetical protein [Catenulispora pinistramenti]MBS2553507.1 hypothetical protein [Catenulispora pinistramenti]
MQTTSKAPPPQAPTSTTVAISGSVTCLSGNAVTGVWVDVAQGAGFSPWWPTANPATATYGYTLPVSEPYALHVGCGGTQPSWAVATATPPVSGTQNSFNCDDISGDADYGACVRR